jgi:hypothetical protein
MNPDTNPYNNGIYEIIFMDTHSVEDSVMVTTHAESVIGLPPDSEMVFNVREEQWQKIPSHIVSIEQLTGVGAPCNEKKIQNFDMSDIEESLDLTPSDDLC